MSASMAALIGGMSYGQVRYDIVDMSPTSGDTFARLLGPPRWRIGLRSKRAMALTDAGIWEGALLKLRGGINHLAVWDVLRPAPQGTMRGAPYAELAAAGATSVDIWNMVGTLKAGDWIGIGTAGLGTMQLVKVTDDATSTVPTSATGNWTTTTPSAATWSTTAPATATWSTAGTATVNFEPPLRNAITRWTTVTWDKPVAYYKATNDALTWDAVPNGPAIDGFAIDLLEHWA